MAFSVGTTLTRNGIGQRTQPQWTLSVQRVAELFDDHSLCVLAKPERRAPVSRVAQPQISIPHLVPGPLIQERWNAVQGTTLFSATLSPMDFVADLLGLPSTVLDACTEFTLLCKGVHGREMTTSQTP